MRRLRTWKLALFLGVLLSNSSAFAANEAILFYSQLATYQKAVRAITQNPNLALDTAYLKKTDTVINGEARPHLKNLDLLFKNKFFTLSTRADETICSTSHLGYFSLEKIQDIVREYEDKVPGLRAAAVGALTNFSNREWKETIRQYRNDCRTSADSDLCLLTNVLESEESSLRALALFYDTKIMVSRGNGIPSANFSPDHLRSFEKTIRRVPIHLRKIITRGANDAFGSTLINGEVPLRINASHMDGVGLVVYGHNSISFDPEHLDRATDGRHWSDIKLEYLIDFRLQHELHEIGHVLDQHFYWDGKPESMKALFGTTQSISKEGSEFFPIMQMSMQALWPNRWHDAFEGFMDVKGGRYGSASLLPNEMFAELFAQYILIPKLFKTAAPEAYEWMKSNLFADIEYEGYENCEKPIVRELTKMEMFFSRKLNPN